MATIDKTMSIGQVLEIDRTTAPIMMEYGMHCMGCPSARWKAWKWAAPPTAPMWTSW